MKEKKRTAVHFNQMSDEVAEALAKKSKGSGVARWVIAEKILESVLLPKSNIDVKKWLKSL